MTIFDLLFILLFLISAVTLLTAAVAGLRGRRSLATNILRKYAICFAIYMTVVFAVAFFTPRRIVQLGEDRCFDDWCVAVQHAEHIGDAYSVTFKISSTARRVTQREKGIHVYLTDSQGRRFDPETNPSVTPFDVLLEPGQTVETSRSFALPKDEHGVGVVVAHEGSYCFPGCFIVGDDGNPLHQRTVVPLP
jgi:hypothetical protein